MSMKIKAIIMRKDHRNDYVILSPKKLASNTFKHKNNGYRINSSDFQITDQRAKLALGLAKKYFTTYYFLEGHPNPIPIHDLLLPKKAIPEGLEEAGLKKWLEENPAEYKRLIDAGISAEELAALFTPWFFRIIAAQAMTPWEQFQFYLQVGTAGGVAYLIWMIIQLKDRIDLIAPPGAP